MAIIQAVENGKVVQDATTNTTNRTKEKNGSTLDKEAFLKLLVAQMKYQDPLEPTDNTEYVAQLATFSQLEETQNQTDVLETQIANDLVGKQVIMKVTSAVTGDETYETGQVDYVYRQGGKVYLYVGGNPYTLDELDSIVEDNYLDAVNLAKTFSAMVELLPSKEQATLADKSNIEGAVKAYQALNGYQRSFIDEKDAIKLQELDKKMKTLSGDTTDSKSDTDNEA